MVISGKPLHFIGTLLIALLPLSGFSQQEADSVRVGHTTVTSEVAGNEQKVTVSEGDKAGEERSEYIQHHLLDSHDFMLFSYGKASGEEKHFGFPLPVILWDNGLQVFSSEKFHHGEAVAEHNGNYYKLHHGKIFKTDAAGTIREDESHHAENDAPLDLSITKNVVMILFTGLLMVLLFAGLAKSYKKNGGIASGAGRFFEPIVLYIRDEIAIPNIGEKHYKKYMSHLLTIFFFVWFLNMFGLTPLGVNVTGNIAITAALAILTFIITNTTANKNYWKHIFWMPGVPAPMKVVLAPIELLGVIIKPFSLMIRLYANILAGHVVLMSIIALMYTFNNWIGSPLSFLLAFVLSLLEILVALLQAYIFTMLSALYFGMAKEEHDHDDHH
jgi:F-type H+-transporting ATPase subunit a